jgi:hypothetical protein
MTSVAASFRSSFGTRFSCVVRTLCSLFLQLLHVENLALLNGALRTLSRILLIFHRELKLQLEMFVRVIIDIFSQKDVRVYYLERCEAFIETLAQVRTREGLKAILEPHLVFRLN